MRLPIAPMLVLASLSALLVPTAAFLRAQAKPAGPSPFEECLEKARAALARNDLTDAGVWVRQALERDAKSRAAWTLRARWAEGLADSDELVWSLHNEYRLAVAQKAPRPEVDALRKRLDASDPIAKDALDMGRIAIDKLNSVADQLEKEKRPHSAIRVYKQILALDPERAAAADAIQRLASVPDPSLAGEAKPKDLLAGISEEWIAKHDAEHAEWDTRARLEKLNYVTLTDAGYEILVRAAEAMEQMNAFYRQFFRYGTEEDKHGVSRIELRIFKDRDEYLKKGQSPAKWSGGQFTGDAVETYVGEGGFQDMVGTLFHEAAHQFVALATQASGWLNEGLASFFEGTRVLSNGSVIMNLPANHRLFPLVERMHKGWMSGPTDGFDPENTETEPAKAPTFAIVLENKYEWGPPWYAPTWGVVYFLYNYQDLEDGRFVYRNAFLTFIDKSAGREGEGAVANFEKVVLANPEPVTPGVNIPASRAVALPKSAAELDPVWKKWMEELRDEQSGKLQVDRPYRKWARYAVQRKDWRSASELYEKGLIATPSDTGLLYDYAQYLAEQEKKADRAAQLLTQALRAFEQQEKPDKIALAQAEKLLDKLDPKRKSLARIQDEIAAVCRGVAQRYLSADLPLMAMEVSWKLGVELRVPALLDIYTDAARRSGKSPVLWQLAYNEKDLQGWSAAGTTVYRPDGRALRSQAGPYSENSFAFQFLALDRMTSGDFSVEAELNAEKGKAGFAGLMFGKKSDSTFHALIYFPGKPETAETAGSAFIDLTSFYGGSNNKTWIHTPVEAGPAGEPQTGALWHKLRIDITGRTADLWFDGKLLTSREFPSLDVLRGSFGLITGPGQAAFRNVRFLSRSGNDPTGPIERALRMEGLATTESLASGSYLGSVPPFPVVKQWVQGERKSWDEKGLVPQLFVLWSIDQNEVIPIGKWLTEVHEQNWDIGLEIVSVCSYVRGVDPLAPEQVAQYLKEHPFPGAVALDHKDKSTWGETFEIYQVQKFNLPRLILMDIDGRVAWEGDPGFKRGGPKTGEASYLKDPLDELIGKRKLKEFLAWKKTWEAKAEPALKAGDLKTALPVLQEASKLSGKIAPVVAEAQGVLDSLGLALSSLDAFAATLVREECEPALQVIVEWGVLIGKPVDKKALAQVRGVSESKAAVRWAKLMADLPAWKTKLGSPKAEEKAGQFVQEIEAIPGRFGRELLADLKPKLDAKDYPGLIKLLDDAPRRPALWLAREYFHW